LAPCLSWHHLKTPVSIRSADQSPQTNTQNPRKAAILSGSMTLADPASSPQVIENKNIAGMNEITEARNQGKCPQNLAYHDIS
jgi:hypothetical protein